LQVTDVLAVEKPEVVIELVHDPDIFTPHKVKGIVHVTKSVYVTLLVNSLDQIGGRPSPI